MPKENDETFMRYGRVEVVSNGDDVEIRSDGEAIVVIAKKHAGAIGWALISASQH